MVSIVTNRLFRKALYSFLVICLLHMSETTHANASPESFCLYCGGKLTRGFHFVCHVCGRSYCYIHMMRHSRAHSQRRLTTAVAAT